MKKPDNFDQSELDIKKSNLSNISNNVNCNVKKQSEGYNMIDFISGRFGLGFTGNS